MYLKYAEINGLKLYLLLLFKIYSLKTIIHKFTKHILFHKVLMRDRKQYYIKLTNHKLLHQVLSRIYKIFKYVNTFLILFFNVCNGKMSKT